MSSFWLVPKQQWAIKISSPLFLFLAWWPSWLKVGITGNSFGRGPSKDHYSKVWSKLAQWILLRRILKCEKFTTDNEYDIRRTKPDGKSSHGLWPGELKNKKIENLCLQNKINYQNRAYAYIACTYLPFCLIWVFYCTKYYI